jgi:hypothetical protein
MNLLEQLDWNRDRDILAKVRRTLVRLATQPVCVMLVGDFKLGTEMIGAELSL